MTRTTGQTKQWPPRQGPQDGRHENGNEIGNARRRRWAQQRLGRRHELNKQTVANWFAFVCLSRRTPRRYVSVAVFPVHSNEISNFAARRGLSFCLPGWLAGCANRKQRRVSIREDSVPVGVFNKTNRPPQRTTFTVTRKVLATRRWIIISISLFALNDSYWVSMFVAWLVCLFVCLSVCLFV